MKQAFFFLIVLFALGAKAQDAYWQQRVNFHINATLDDKNKTISGDERFVYYNNSPTTLDFIWIHLWPNAYKNKKTALYEQIKNDPARKGKASEFSFGSIEGLNFKVNGKTTGTLPHPNPKYIDIVKLPLATPIKPGDSVVVETPFVVNLPKYFSRSGYADGQFMACQWYPKPAVFDKDGWHEMPYLDMGEYYSNFADFTVNITLPSAYVVGATGVLQTAAELEQYKSIGRQNATIKGKHIAYTPPATPTKTLTYQASNVPDFAWFADKDFIVEYDTAVLYTGKVVDAFSFFHNKKKTLWDESLVYVKDAVRYYSNAVGEYEYPTVQAVEGPKNNSSGGMEYPMITLITSPDANPQRLDAVIAHEVGHNWFMSMLGSNERQHTWQDEGLNTYIQFRYEAEKFRGNSIFGDAIPEEVKKLDLKGFQNSIYTAMTNIPMKLKIDVPADSIANSDDYGMSQYIKTALWLYMLEATIGRDEIDKAFKQYFADWRGKHPTPLDMQRSFEKALGKDLTAYFDLLNKEDAF